MKALIYARFEKLENAMESTRSCRSSAPVLPLNCFPLHRSLSRSSAPQPSSSRTSSSIYSSSSAFNFFGHNSLSSNRNSLAYSSESPVAPKVWNSNTPARPKKAACMCSPTNHPGSFRCSLHRNSPPPSSSASTNSQLHMRRSAMKNSLVRIGSVEGEWVKRALAALIRPSSHQMRRRMSFQPQPSRFRQMIRAQNIP